MSTPSTPDVPPRSADGATPLAGVATPALTPTPPVDPIAPSQRVTPALPSNTASETDAKGVTQPKTKAEKQAAKQAVKDAPPPKGNPVGWSGLLIAVVAIATQSLLLNFVVNPGTGGGAVLAYNPPGLLWDPTNGLASFLLLITLIAAITAVVVAVVALFGKRKPQWISWVSIGVGLSVLISTVAFWQGVATLS